MKLEVGKRYVLRNGVVTGSLYECGERMSDERKSWLTNGGHYYSSAQMSGLDIVAEYVEPQPQQPLRWVENCRPDKPGIWAFVNDGGFEVACWHDPKKVLVNSTICYLGPIPEILPPVKKVVERLWLEHLDAVSSAGSISPSTRATYEHHWLSDEAKADPSWIGTDRTREREI